MVLSGINSLQINFYFLHFFKISYLPHLIINLAFVCRYVFLLAFCSCHTGITLRLCLANKIFQSIIRREPNKKHVSKSYSHSTYESMVQKWRVHVSNLAPLLLVGTWMEVVRRYYPPVSRMPFWRHCGTSTHSWRRHSDHLNCSCTML